MARDGGLCCCCVGRPHTGLITLPARLRGPSEAAGEMRPGAICLQPLDQMACKDSWGGVERGYIHQAPSRSQSLLQSYVRARHCRCDCTDQTHEAQHGRHQ